MTFAANIDAEDTHAKQAALLLHAMAPSDRDWVLNQLTGPHRELLDILLSELQEFAIPADPRLMKQLFPKEQGSAIVKKEAAPVSNLDFLMSLEPSDISALANAWASEPPYLIAQGLSIQSWAWKSALLSQLPAIQRRRVVEILHNPPSDIDAKNLRAETLMACMRVCCESARQTTTSQELLPKNRKSLLWPRIPHSWQRWSGRRAS